MESKIKRSLVGMALGISVCLCTLISQSQTITQKRAARPYSQHERFATFLSDNDFTSTLMLQNLRADVPLTFKTSLILRDAEVPLANVTVPAHSTSSVDISAFLRNHGYADDRGTVSVRFDFTTYGPGMAVVESADERDHFYLNSYAQSPEEYWAGTSYDAVVWAPQQGTEGFISLTNSSTEPRIVHTTFITADGRSEPQHDIQIAPRQTRILRIDDLLDRAGRTGAGIHLDVRQEPNENYAGNVLVDGQIFNKGTGFAKHIHFMDKALQFPTGTLRSHFLMLGQQPAEDNFPSTVSFRSVAAVRNIDTAPVKVTPTVKFLRDGSLQTIALEPFILGVAQTRTIDFAAEQTSGRIPTDFHQGTLELSPDSGQVSIVGELFNFSEKGGYVVGPSFTSYPSRATASIWRTDGGFQTTIVAENTAADDDQVTLKLFSEGRSYTKTFSAPADGLLKINIKQLQEDSVPDDAGHVLSGSSGVLQIIGGHNTDSRLAYEKIIHNAAEADYVGLPPTQCDYVEGVDLFVDQSSGTQPFPVMFDYYWAFSGDQYEPAWGTASSNSSLAQISSSGGDMVTFIPPSDGQQHTVTLSHPLGPLSVQICDACSGGNLYVGLFGIQIEVPTTKSQTDFTNPDTDHLFSPDGTVFCAVKPWCTPQTSPPACNPSFVDQAPPVAGREASCQNYYITTWLAFKTAADTFWVCLPLLPDQNATGTSDPSLGNCTKQ